MVVSSIVNLIEIFLLKIETVEFCLFWFFEGAGCVIKKFYKPSIMKFGSRQNRHHNIYYYGTVFLQNLPLKLLIRPPFWIFQTYLQSLIFSFLKFFRRETLVMDQIFFKKIRLKLLPICINEGAVEFFNNAAPSKMKIDQIRIL